MPNAIDIRHYLPFTKTGQCLRLESGFELEVEEEKFRATVLQEDLLLLKISHGGRWEETPSHAVCADIASMKAEFSVEEKEDEIRLTTAAITLRVLRNPFCLEAFRSDGTVIFQTAFDRQGTSWAYARLNDHFVTVRQCRHEDAFFGLGEKTGRFNRKGRNFTLWNTDVLNPNATGEFVAKHKSGDPRADPLSTEFDPYYVSIPFFYHLPHMQTAMAGFFFDNPYRATFRVFRDRRIPGSLSRGAIYRIRFCRTGDEGYLESLLHVDWPNAGPAALVLRKSSMPLVSLHAGKCGETGRVTPPETDSLRHALA